MYIKSLEITNLRCFTSASVDFVHPAFEAPHRATRAKKAEKAKKAKKAKKKVARPPARPAPPAGGADNVTVLLGNNGVGKTTVLRAIAMSTLAPLMARSSGHSPFSLVRRVRGAPAEGTAKACVALHEQDGHGGEYELEARLETASAFNDVYVVDRGSTVPWWKAMFDEESKAFLVVGYGASRRVETSSQVELPTRSKRRALRFHRVAGLFEEDVPLVPLSAWFPHFQRKNPGRAKQTVTLLNKLLPEGTKFVPGRDEELMFTRDGVKLPFGALSDGYRAFLGWVADLLFHISIGAGSGQRLDETQGIVLVDEIDLHLHPEWQRVVVTALATAFPRLQFVITTHSPIVVGTLEARNVRVLEKVGDHVEIRPALADPFGLSADQILTSPAFGLESTRDPRFLEQLAEVAEAANSGRDKVAKRRAALDFMRMLSGGAAAATEPPPTGRGNGSGR